MSAPAVSDTNVCEGKEVTTFLTEAMRATPSQIGYVRKGAAGELTKVGVYLLRLLARSPALAMWWLGVAKGQRETSLLPRVFPRDNIRDIIIREPSASAF